tara:strand:+ start:1515 stop:1925 length:411 start_codon:yes stop_codon:yes gene_type:complete
MLLQVNDSDYDIYTTIKENCGNEYTLINRIAKNNFGSSKYKLLELSPVKFNLDIKNYTDSVYLNFDLRDKGIVFFFRFRNTEYVEFCPYYKLSLQSNDDSFVIQTDQNIYKFKILNKKKHKNFLLKLYEFKSKKNK